MIVIIFWVDDVIVGASNENLLGETKQLFKENFKDMEQLSYFLGIDFEQGQDFVRMQQQRYIQNLLEKFEMSDCKPRGTPCEQKLEWSECEPFDSKRYREIVGSLIYLMMCTRREISWVVTRLSQFLSKPLQCHWITLKHVLRYLKGTAHYDLCYRKCEKGLRITGYTDSDWASSMEDRRSTSGYCFSFSLVEDGPLISWKSRKQQIVALSTCEAEYIALTAAVQEVMYLSHLVKSIGITYDQLPIIYEDNQGTIALANNPTKHQRSKHIDVRYHLIRSEVNKGFELKYCPTEEMLADIMTKPATKQLNKFKTLLFGR
ncbi:hypothetical protein RRG08_016389 [Elysia crispata]|uniref:Reverse transcriptase Ty1/copia-type domain-containing protein n=1 Tax=Elysia crispata TaxID=231223 RepID=A0AAE0Y8Q1_9GAST|nr:hypothetical protein RRG08_016389 [Elysia crispata]